MKSPRHNQSLLAVLGLTVATLVPGPPALQAAVTLDANDVFMAAGTPTGDLTIAGDLSVVKGIDFGTAATNPALAAVQLTYFGGLEHATMFDLSDALGSFQWRDNLLDTARNKMTLDSGNLLTLYKSDGTVAGILLNPDTGQIHLSGTGGGIYAGGTPVFTLDASGKLVFGTRPLSLANTSASSSSSSGALTVAGGIGVALDSYINGIRVGRGGGNVTTNTAYGVNTLQANTIGAYNTATGYYALKSNITGSSNTAAGYYSLYTNSTGAYNTAAGCYSLYANSSGYYNTAAGYYSLYANSTGYYNTAAGYYALGRNTTGYYNTASGSSAMGGNSSGYSNTAAGYYALFSNTTGTSNVAIGSNAGRYQENGSSTLTDPDNSIYLGANSRGFSNLDQNSIVIGSAAIGEGANTTVIGNSTTVKTHLFGSAAIGRYPNQWGSATAWVETDPLLLVGNGSSTALASNAITTLKNGQTTLTNKEWKANSADPLADPAATTDSGGEALVVDGHTRLRGKVIIEQAQGDISMGIYGPQPLLAAAPAHVPPPSPPPADSQLPSP